MFDEFNKVKDLDAIPDEEYEPKKARIVRSINILKKIALEKLAEGFGKAYEDPDSEENKDPKIPFYIGSKYDEEIGTEVYFDCGPMTHDPKIRTEKLRIFYKTLGFDDSHFTKPGDFTITKKGAGMVRYTKRDRVYQ
jgi:hypothetical protein